MICTQRNETHKNFAIENKFLNQLSKVGFACARKQQPKLRSATKNKSNWFFSFKFFSSFFFFGHWAVSLSPHARFNYRENYKLVNEEWIETQMRCCYCCSTVDSFTFLSVNWSASTLKPNPLNNRIMRNFRLTPNAMRTYRYEWIQNQLNNIELDSHSCHSSNPFERMKCTSLCTVCTASVYIRFSKQF